MSALRSFFTRTLSVLVFAGLGACGYTCPPGNPLGRFGCHVPCEDLPSLARSRCTVIAADAARDARADVVADASDTGVDTGMRDGSMDDADVADVPRVDVVDEGDGSVAADAPDANDASIIVDPMLPAPRAIAPLSTSIVTSQRPTLRWLNDPMIDGARVEVSRTRTFTSIEWTVATAGDRARIASNLAPGVWFWRLRGRTSGRMAEGATSSPVWWFRVGARSADADRDTSSGTELDVNGDGYTDLAVGSPLADGGQGRVDLFYGGPAGIPASPSLTLRGVSAGDQFGARISSAGDVNGDGVADLVVGAPFADPGTRVGAGTATVFLGSLGGLTSVPARTIEGTAAGAYLGSSVSSAGDLNADGFADLLVGVPLGDAGARRDCGLVLVFHGSATGIPTASTLTLEGPTADEGFGSSVASAGDVNADGFADIIVGSRFASPAARMFAGSTRVFHGSSGGVAIAAARTIDGATMGDGLGSAVVGAGDVNGDGFSDVLIASGDALPGGRVDAHLGSASGIVATAQRTWTGAAMGEQLGSAISGVGDVNRDGFADVAIGSSGATVGGRTTAGTVAVLHGAPTGLPSTATLRLDGASMGGLFGYALGAAADYNGDGFGDFCVGARSASPSGRMTAGSAFVFHGSMSGIVSIPARPLDGANAGDTFGHAVASSEPTRRASAVGRLCAVRGDRRR